MTAMVLLTANSMRRPRHEKMAFDSQLVSSGLEMVQTMAAQTGNDGLQSFRDTCGELHQEAQRRSLIASSMEANKGDFLSSLDSQWAL